MVSPQGEKYQALFKTKLTSCCDHPTGGQAGKASMKQKVKPVQDRARDRKIYLTSKDRSTSMKPVRMFLLDDKRATAIEYALIASLIAVVIISAVSLVGPKASTVFSEVGNSLKYHSADC